MPTRPLTPIARKLRQNQTDAEKRLWSHLRSRQLSGAKFVRQFPIGPYIADFACRSLMPVIELDGGQHAENPADAQRTRIIESHGYRLIRFWNNDVLSNPERRTPHHRRNPEHLPQPRRLKPLTPTLSPKGRGSQEAKPTQKALSPRGEGWVRGE